LKVPCCYPIGVFMYCQSPKGHHSTK